MATLRKMMNHSLEEGCGIYRDEKSLQETCNVIAEVRGRYTNVALEDKSSVYNTDLYQTLELGAMIQCAETARPIQPNLSVRPSAS